jgi:uncharacterized protein (TIGR02001 family)
MKTMTFKKTLVAASLAALSMAAMSEEAAVPAADDIAVTANVTLASSYRFRGIDQTFNQPAIQGGFDVTLPKGFYVGNWNSNVNGNAAGMPQGNIEVDLYGGWKFAVNEDIGTDIGVMQYLYPGSKWGGGLEQPTTSTFGVKQGMVNNTEIYLGGNWKTVSLKQSFAVTDYFNAKGINASSTAGSGYTDLTATYDLGGFDNALAGWGVVGHAGYFYMKNYSAANYADWKLGITKDIGSGWLATVSYIQAATSGNCSNTSSPQPYCFAKNGWNADGTANGSTQNAGHATAVVTIGRTF